MVDMILDDAMLAMLTAGVCPDCGKTAMVGGPRGGLSRNVACSSCGAEFNETRVDGAVALAHRNSRPGSPDRRRLAEVFGIADLTAAGVGDGRL